eukprot:1155518-Pelagomonas_calceolata.AAC.6
MPIIGGSGPPLDDSCCLSCVENGPSLRGTVSRPIQRGPAGCVLYFLKLTLHLRVFTWLHLRGTHVSPLCTHLAATLMYRPATSAYTFCMINYLAGKMQNMWHSRVALANPAHVLTRLHLGQCVHAA